MSSALLYQEELSKINVILASGSPRRKELLERIGVTFSVVKSNFAEDLSKEGIRPEKYAILTAHHKGLEVWQSTTDAAAEDQLQLPDLIISADSIVVTNDGKILEKASTPEEARAMIKELSGQTHRVITGLVLFARTAHNSHVPPLTISHAESTTVHFSQVSDAEIDSYVARPVAWEGKAGAYGIQDLAATFIPRIEGCYYNVMGFPVHVVWKLLKELIEKQQLASLTPAPTNL